MQRNQTKHQTPQILRQIIKHPQTLRIHALRHVHQTPDLRHREGNVLVPHLDLQLLPPRVLRGLYPLRVVQVGDIGTLNDAAGLLDDGGGNVDFLADHGGRAVVGVVGVAEFAGGGELEFHEFVAEFSAVPDVVSDVEFVVGGAVPFDFCHGM